MRITLKPLCGANQDIWGHGGDIFGYNTWSMHTQDGAQQITTVANQDVTVTPETAGRRQLVFLNGFCASTLPTARIQSLN